jgi:hypothetical protein
VQAASTEPAEANGREADNDEGDASGQDVAEVVAGLTGPGFVFVQFDVVSDATSHVSLLLLVRVDL